MNVWRKLIRSTCVALVFACASVEAQQPTKSSYRIGLLTVGFFAPGQIEAFRDGMRALGYHEGKDFGLEIRYAEGDLPG